MKAFSFKDQRLLWLFLPLLVAVVFVGCSDDDDDPEPSADPVASFQFEIDANDFLTVNFTNFSQNATSYDWDFGDGNSSTVTNPSHTYSAAGEYEVILIASNADGKTAMRSQSITITDPEAARKLLTGETSKTWKLFREGTSMALWDSPDKTQNFWPGLTNDGARPCLYEQEFTFHFDGTYEFNDNGMFWGEFGVWGAVTGCTDSPLLETCFDATPANMVNACGDDVSAWLSGTHQFSYDATTGELTLTGNGAWIGIPKLTATTDAQITPVSEVVTKISIEQFTGYDVMTVEFIYGGTYWPIVYASYSDPSLEPELVTDKAPFGEDYDDISPTSMGNAFDGTFDLLDTVIQSASNVVYGVEDPADAMAPAVGQFNRTNAQFQELQLQTKPTKNDINFENLTTVSLDVYLPSSNDYSGSLSKAVIIGLADKGATEQWWTDNMEFVNDGTMLAEDEWITLTYDLSMPSNAANGGTPFDRNDFDMIYINIGGSNHTETGTFYVRNLRFE